MKLAGPREDEYDLIWC